MLPHSICVHWGGGAIFGGVLLGGKTPPPALKQEQPLSIQVIICSRRGLGTGWVDFGSPVPGLHPTWGQSQIQRGLSPSHVVNCCNRSCFFGGVGFLSTWQGSPQGLPKPDVAVPCTWPQEHGTHLGLKALSGCKECGASQKVKMQESAWVPPCEEFLLARMALLVAELLLDLCPGGFAYL